ncbi:unnamed protein product [Trifolium pratense]|uniref:Uncharacterized protein n=1 Tax=Trifolium pratense TaxID=57577 RepID=A0ACB0KVG0_TRIPR|nr:unnamed protein product [Trifolium pratense]
MLPMKREKDDSIYPYFDNLPEPLTTQILLQLPINTLLICRCVCTNWKMLISEPRFAKLHFQQSPTCFMIRPCDVNDSLVSRTMYLLECDPQKFQIGCNNHVKLAPIFKLPLRDTKFKNKKRDNNPLHYKFLIANSCNGLLCLCHPYKGNPSVICNPITGEFIRLPKPTTVTPPSSYKGIDLFRLSPSSLRIEPIVAFGFQPKTNEYKVIKLCVINVRRHMNPSFQRLTLQIHTLGTPSWRNVEVDHPIFISSLTHATSVNGTLHWIRFGRWQVSILCFNFESERLQSFPSAHVFEKNEILDKGRISMGELRGFLYICDASSPHGITMWIMKNYGIGESWTNVYNIDTFLSNDLSSHIGSYWPVKHFEEGAALLSYHSSNCFIFYEPGKYGFKVFRIHGIHQSKYFQLIPHIPSLISLKDVVKGDNVEVLNIHSRCAKLELCEENEVVSLVQEFVCDLASTCSLSSYGKEFGDEHAS